MSQDKFYSLALEWLELLVHIGPGDGEAAVIPLLHEACIHKLADEV